MSELEKVVLELRKQLEHANAQLLHLQTAREQEINQMLEEMYAMELQQMSRVSNFELVNSGN